MEQITAQQVDPRAELIDRIENDLGAFGLPAGRIPEDVFAAIFLKMFAGEPEHPDATIGNWISIAGSPFNPVVVFNDNKDLFVVPPVVNNNAISPKPTDRSLPVSHIVSTAEQLALRSPAEATNYLNSKLAQTSRSMIDVLASGAYVAEWNVIFRHYNMPSIGAVDTENPKAMPHEQTKLFGPDTEFEAV